MIENLNIGFIGQGYIGKNYADDFEARGYSVVRYSLEEPFIKNKDKIADCDIVFIAVPTPTTPDGFDGNIVEEAVRMVGAGKIAVIKSTIIPGTTERLQSAYPGIIILNSPEFLSETTAAYDAAHPPQNIIGVPVDAERHQKAAALVLSVLPPAPMFLVCKSVEAEIFKYVHNLNGYVQIVLFNMFYDLTNNLGGDWKAILGAIQADPFMADRYADPVHKSGRGAGGHCFIKDFTAFAGLYEQCVGDKEGITALHAFEEKNKKLLKDSKKDIELLEGVYGKE